MDNSDLTALIMAGNQAAMEWYSLATAKPLPRTPAGSLMGAIVGTDFGPAGRYGSAPATLGGGVIILALVALAAVMLLSRK